MYLFPFATIALHWTIFSFVCWSMCENHRITAGMEDKSPRDLFHSLCLCQKSTHPKSATRNFSLSPLHQEADYGCSRRLRLLVSLETSVSGAKPWNPRLKEHASFFLFERHSRNPEALLKEGATEPHAPAYVSSIPEALLIPNC